MSDERAYAIPEVRWPVVTAWIKAELGETGASPVTLGVGRDGPRVGYYSGGRCPADRSEHELWLRLDPHALAALPEVLAAAAPHMAGSGEAEGLCPECQLPIREGEHQMSCSRLGSGEAERTVVLADVVDWLNERASRYRTDEFAADDFAATALRAAAREAPARFAQDEQ